MITTKRHKEILEKVYKQHEAEMKELAETYSARHKNLTEELEKAQNLKDILEKFSSMTIFGKTYATCGGSWSNELVITDSIAQYVDDYFGGKVIKQEATKVIEIAVDGKVGTAYTRQKPDKGFTHKLIRKDVSTR